jgi:hypothetical protein
VDPLMAFRIRQVSRVQYIFVSQQIVTPIGPRRF